MSLAELLELLASERNRVVWARALREDARRRHHNYGEDVTDTMAFANWLDPRHVPQDAQTALDKLRASSARASKTYRDRQAEARTSA